MANMSLSEIIELSVRQGQAFGISGSLTVAASDDDLPDITLGNAGYSYTGFMTGANPVIFYSRKVAFNSVGFIAYVYRNPTFVGGSIGGTSTQSFRNVNDINAGISGATLTGGLAANGAAGDVESLGEETVVREFVFGNESNQGAGGRPETLDEPIIMLPNTQYLLVFKNKSTSSAQNFGSHLRWCEPDRIQGLVIKDGGFSAYNGEEFLS